MSQPIVLLVDDEAHVSAVLGRRFTSSGFEVVVVGDGREAIEKAQEVRPALVVTDYQMPHMDGLETAEQLAQLELTSRTPIIMLTGRDHLVDESRRAKTNIAQVFQKPFSVREIVDVARELIESRSENAA